MKKVLYTFLLLFCICLFLFACKAPEDVKLVSVEVISNTAESASYRATLTGGSIVDFDITNDYASAINSVDGVYADVQNKGFFGTEEEWRNAVASMINIKVAFDSKGGSLVETQNVHLFDKITVPTAPVKEGYHFIGWNYNGAVWSFSENSALTDITLEAQWKKIDYSLSFVLNGATSSNNPVGFSVDDLGKPLSPPVFSNLGDVYFAGWYEDASFTNKVSALAECKNYTLYAKFITGTENGIEFIPDGTGGYMVTGYTGGESELFIPAIHNGAPVTKIVPRAFFASSITAIGIPSTVKSIGDLAFDGCRKLEKVYITDLAKWCSVDFGNDNLMHFFSANPLYYAKNLYLDGQLLNELVIPEGVGAIADYAFINASFSSLRIPSTVFAIGMSAFRGCDNLSSLTIPDTVVSVGASAFYACSELTEAVIGNGISKLPDSVFSNCSKLSSIVIPSNVNEIGDSAFSACTALEIVTVPDTVKRIGTSAFLNCYNLREINLPSGLSDISASSFYSCVSLPSIRIPDGVTNIGQSAFFNCASLSSVYLPSGLVSIQNSAFHSCKSLETIIIPETVIFVGEHAFALCDKLTSVENGISYVDKWVVFCNKNAVVAPLRNDTLGIAYGAFSLCTELTEVVIPDTVKAIGDCAFFGCAKIANVKIGESVTYIGSNAFNSCSAITEIIIPDSVTGVGAMAFANCSGLSSVQFGSGILRIDYLVFDCCPRLSSVSFEIVDSWYYVSDVAFTNGMPVNLGDSEANAVAFQSTYKTVYLKRY